MRGGIAISLHHSQTIPVPEMKCFISKSGLYRLVGVCTLGFLLEGKQEGKGSSKTTTCLTHQNGSKEIRPHALKAL